MRPGDEGVGNAQPRTTSGAGTGTGTNAATPPNVISAPIISGTGSPTNFGYPTVTAAGTLALTNDPANPFTVTPDGQGGVVTNVMNSDGTYVSTNAEGTGPSGTSGDGSTPIVPKEPALDWSAWMANWGFDQPTIDALTAIFAKYTNGADAAAAGLAYIRSLDGHDGRSDWYARNFAGIGEGERNGMFSMNNPEQDYRAYVGQIDGVYQSFFQRSPTTAEVQSWITGGRDANYVNNHFTGQAKMQAEMPQDQYLLGAYDEGGQATGDQLSAFGDTLGGIGNTIGPQLQEKLNRAKQKYQSLFSGGLAGPSISLLNGKPVGQSLGPDVTKPDIAA